MEGVLSQLPLVTINWRLKSQKPGKEPDSPAKRVGQNQFSSPRNQKWLDVAVDEECVVVMEITRQNLKEKVCTVHLYITIGWELSVSL